MKLSKNKKVEPIQPITRTQPTKRREVPYQGDIDPAVIIHSSKTHRTASEAFKDADYAQAFWCGKSDFEELLDFVGGAVTGALWVLVVALGLFCLVQWVIH